MGLRRMGEEVTPMVDKRHPMTCTKHGDYFGDAAGSPCPSCEDAPEAPCPVGDLVEACRYTLDNLDSAASEGLITAPRWFQAQLGESRKLLRAALAMAESPAAAKNGG